MVQAYHAVPVSIEHEDLDDERGAENEGSALLGGKASTVGLVQKDAEREGRATLTSSVSNLANTIIGSGACAASFLLSYRLFSWQVFRHAHFPSGMVLRLPLILFFNGLAQAFASAGIIPGMLTCVFSGGVAAFGLYLLSACARRTPHRRASFFAIATLTFPRAAVFFDAAIAIKCFGVSIRYATTHTTSDTSAYLGAVILSSSSRSFQLLSRLCITTLPHQIPTHQSGRLAGACGSLFLWWYLCRYLSFVV
jgi:hypothetical protein